MPPAPAAPVKPVSEKTKAAMEDAAPIEMVREVLKEFDPEFEPFVKPIEASESFEMELSAMESVQGGVEVAIMMETTTQTYTGELEVEKGVVGVQTLAVEGVEVRKVKMEGVDAAAQTIHDVLVAEYEEFSDLSDDEDFSEEEDEVREGEETQQPEDDDAFSFPSGSESGGASPVTKSQSSGSQSGSRGRRHKIQRGVEDYETGIAWCPPASSKMMMGKKDAELQTVEPSHTTKSCERCEGLKVEKFCSDLVDEMISSAVGETLEDKFCKSLVNSMISTAIGELNLQTDTSVQTELHHLADATSMTQTLHHTHASTNTHLYETTQSSTQSIPTLTAESSTLTTPFLFTSEAETQVSIGVSLEESLRLQARLKEMELKMKLLEAENAKLKGILKREHKSKGAVVDVVEGLTRLTLKKMVEGDLKRRGLEAEVARFK
ncbi:hypothetical protein HDV05_008789 [Chytridiales sp. JEL 0842]|nr:hypothetical protein HDV05_008789 [Chytridiales sp. JEL 0842]